MHPCGQVVLYAGGVLVLLLAMFLWGIGRTYAGPPYMVAAVVVALLGIGLWVVAATYRERPPPK
jgi:hypothetical protein